MEMTATGSLVRTASRRPEGSVEQLREMLVAGNRGVVFTGAGISTESGIPDFRGRGGIWTKYRPIEFQEFLASKAQREYWHRKFATHVAVVQAKPNQGHLAVAELVKCGKVSVVITQNIDGLHQASGVPADRVIELHGNTTYAHCLQCGREYDLEPIRQAFLAELRAVRRRGQYSDDLVWSGYAKARDERAKEETLRAGLVIINREATGLDDLADLVIHAEIGPTLDVVVIPWG